MEYLSFQRACVFQLNVIQQFEQWVSFGSVLITKQKIWCWCNERNKLSANPHAFLCLLVLLAPSCRRWVHIFVVGLVSICIAYAD
jgi:hypothetical protein